MANKSRNDDAAHQLQVLADEMVASFGSRMTAIDSIYAEFSADTWPRQAMLDLSAATHALAGSAGTFGYMKISQAARDILDLVRPIMENDVQAGDDVCQSLAAALQTLRDEIATPVAEEGWM